MATQVYRIRQQEPVGLDKLAVLVPNVTILGFAGGGVFDIQIEDSDLADFEAGLERLGGFIVIAVGPSTPIITDFLPGSTFLRSILRRSGGAVVNRAHNVLLQRDVP